MKLKNRLIISNVTIIVVPIVITIAIFLILVFGVYRIFNTDMNYQGFKNLTEAQYGYFYTFKDLKNLSDDFLKKEYQNYILDSLKNRNVDVFVFKGSEQVFGSRNLSLIDQQKCLQNSKIIFEKNNFDMNGKTYLSKAIPVNFKDNEEGRVFLMTESRGQWFGIKELIMICVLVYIGSVIITNIVVSLRISKGILTPLTKLRTTAKDISGGNLETIIVEDGDEEIKKLCATFELMRIKLKEITNERIKVDESRKMLVSSISHDLKTPITTIKGYVEGIMDGIANEPDKVEKYLKTIYLKADLMDKMIDDLFFYSKLDLKQIPFKLEKVEVSQYFGQYVTEVNQEVNKMNIDIVLNSTLDGDKYIIIDKERVKRVMMNIVENAKKYMNKTDSKMEINLRETNASIIIEIKDNGMGIEAKDLSFIFDRFYRGNASRNKMSGSGLGLAISKQIIEGIGGKIWAKSKLDIGTSIIMSIKKEKA